MAISNRTVIRKFLPVSQRETVLLETGNLNSASCDSSFPCAILSEILRFLQIMYDLLHLHLMKEQKLQQDRDANGLNPC